MSKAHSESEYYAPPVSLDLDHYLAEGNKQGVHHSIRYIWAIEAIKEMGGIHRILDYGCGEGYGAHAIAQTFPRIDVVAMDYDPEAIAAAKEKYRSSNLRFMIGDLRQHHRQLGDSTFGLAVSFDVVEHVEHRELFFSNLTRYLAETGCLFLSTPCGGKRPVHANPGWAHHKIEYNARALYDVLRRFFFHVMRIDDPAIEFPLPRHVPHSAMVVLGQQDLFPYQFEYRRSKDACRSRNAMSVIETADSRAMVTMELFEVQFGAVIDPIQFVFKLGDRPSVDRTRDYLRRFSRSKIDAQPRALRTSSDPTLR